MSFYDRLNEVLPNFGVDVFLWAGMALVLFWVLLGAFYLLVEGIHRISEATGHGAYRQEGNPADRSQPRTSHLHPVASRPSMESTFLYDWAKTGSHKR